MIGVIRPLRVLEFLLALALACPAVVMADETRAIRAQGIKLLGWWFPGELNDDAKLILGVIERHVVTPSLWVSGGGGPTANADEQKARVGAEAARLRPIAEATGLYRRR